MRAAALAATAAALSTSVAAGDAPLNAFGINAGGVQFGVPSGKKRAVPRDELKDAIPQVAGTGPILEPNTYLQFPQRVTPRSFAFAARRRGVMLTDGSVYQKTVSGLLPVSWLSAKEPPVPYAYVVDGATGKSIYNMQFFGRKALPYGIAEDPRDGRVAVTFYQAQTDSVEVWQPDLSWKLTYHDVSLKPSIPFFWGSSGEMWIPFTVADRFLEETDKVLQLYIYKKDGSRDETFPRREWSRVKYPHTLRVDGAGRIWAAGLQVWAWEDGVHGPIAKELNETMQPPVLIDVYGLTTDTTSRGSPFVKEQRERWFEQNSAGREPSREMLATTNTHYALLHMASYPFPFVCQWPLFDLTGDGHVVAGCYDQDEVVVYRAYRGGKKKKAKAEAGGAEGDGMELSRTLEEVARFQRPMGITSLGGIMMDPSGGAVGLLDRTRKRVYSAAWPLDAAAMAGDGEDAGTFTARAVTGIKWHDQPGADDAA